MLVVSATLATPAAASPIPGGLSELSAARGELVTDYVTIVKSMGLEQTADLEQRLDNDLGAFLSGETPNTFTKADWAARLSGVASLDSSIVFQAASGKSLPVAGSKGLVERLILARSDRTLEPFALYVPTMLPAHPALVVLLHGRPQTDSELLSEPYFRTLADATETIIAAPYGRDIYDFAPPADDEVYQVTETVMSAYAVDPRRTYLVGYSMGGFSVFKVGPEHPAQWSAVMCVAGSVLNSDAESVRSGFAHTRMYVVNGAKDENIPPQYGELTAQWLAGIGIPTGFYQQPNGTHYLMTLMPVLTKAWHEMLAGTIASDAQPASISQTQLPILAPNMGSIRP